MSKFNLDTLLLAAAGLIVIAVIGFAEYTPQKSQLEQPPTNCQVASK